MDVASYLYGKKGKFIYLFIAACVLIFSFLGAKEIWTQELRWAEIVAGMFDRRDFFHPYIAQKIYYDKPLLSYWLIAFFVALEGKITLFSLRLPSALAGLLCIGCIYRLGCYLKDKTLGLLSGWMLLTTFFFVFWTRTSSADVLTMAGVLFATTIYLEKKASPHFLDYCYFFLVLALSSLCKGLVALVIPIMAVLIDLFLTKELKKAFQKKIFFAALFGLVIYLLPFLVSFYINHDSSTVLKGLYLVYRENLLRYFQPFDHQGDVFTYFIYLPVYLLPWTIFFIPAISICTLQWKKLSINEKWLVLICYAIFIFFTLSGSRRSYYILPLIPFAILLSAHWLLSTNNLKKFFLNHSLQFIIIFLGLFIYFCITPIYLPNNAIVFVKSLKATLSKERTRQDWQFILINAEPKLIYYLGLPMKIAKYKMQCLATKKCLPSRLSSIEKQHTIYITNLQDFKTLAPFFVDYRPFIIWHQTNKLPPNLVSLALIPKENKSVTLS